MRFPRRTSVFLTLVLGLTAGLVVPVTSASAAATDVVINEMMYHPLSDLDGDDYLELANRGTTAVDLSGMDASAASPCPLPPGNDDRPRRILRRVAKDAAPVPGDLRLRPRLPSTAATCPNAGETVALRDAGAATIDSVTYLDVDPWPVKCRRHRPLPGAHRRRPWTTTTS